MTSYEIMKACEGMGANTVEIKENKPRSEEPMEGVVSSWPDGKVKCYVGAGDGSDDCVLTADEFNKRFIVTVAVFV